ncbi:MAG TPA: hypothetical protein O0X50_01615 [Methanocorpusculum sp.]|nr:hypothetical protein [Methanocorpusculum sp.]
MLRTINSILAILVFGLFVLHTSFNVPTLIWYTYNPWSGIFAEIMMVLMVVHALIGICLAITAAIQRRKERTYLGLNLRTFTLMVTGILMLVLTVIHFYSFGYTLPTGEYVINEPNIQMFLVNILFTVVVTVHLALGLENASITFGMRTHANKMPVRVIVYSIAGVVGAAGIIAYVIYYIPTILGVGGV